MAKTKKNEEKEVVEIVEQLCTCCGVKKKVNGTYFYKSYSVLYKNNTDSRMTVCKNCVLEMASNFKIKYGTETKGLYMLCQLLDVYYEKALFESAKSQAKTKNSNVYQIYFQKALSLPQYRNKSFVDSEEFDTELDDEEKAEGISVDLADFFGGGFTANDYDFLEREYENLTARYECDSYAQELLFKEIAFQTLDIRQKRQKGSDVSKELKTLQDLLGSANIKPAQENASMASEQVTFGTLIKKYENEKPIPEPLPSWMDSDWIKKYVTVHFFGNLCKMMGKPNPYQEEYKKELDKYTVKPSSEDGEV